ncbi:MAG: hypothetical protein DLM54_03860 [Acidimicrobiales bacterium]|nr:MAG: hypothetical protein DLM54_03860 [Acidimicrobiales bacterium]
MHLLAMRRLEGCRLEVAMRRLEVAWLEGGRPEGAWLEAVRLEVAMRSGASSPGSRGAWLEGGCLLAGWLEVAWS